MAKLVPWQKCACGAVILNDSPVAKLNCPGLHTKLLFRTAKELLADGMGSRTEHTNSACVFIVDEYVEIGSKFWPVRALRPCKRINIVTGKVESLEEGGA